MRKNLLILGLILFRFVSAYAQDPFILLRSTNKENEANQKAIKLPADTVKNIKPYDSYQKKQEPVFVFNLISRDSLLKRLDALNSQKPINIPVKSTNKEIILLDSLKKREREIEILEGKLQIEKSLQKIKSDLYRDLTISYPKVIKFKNTLIVLPDRIELVNAKIENATVAVDTWLAKLDRVTSLFDTTYTVDMKKIVIESVADNYAKLQAINRGFEALKKGLDNVESFTASTEYIEAVILDSTKYSPQIVELIEKIDTKDTMLRNRLAAYNKTYAEAEKKYIVYDKKLNDIVIRFNKLNLFKDSLQRKVDTLLYTMYNKKKIIDEETQVGALPSLISPLGDMRQLNLNMNLLASFSKRVSTSNYVAVEGRLFTTNITSLGQDNLKNFFLPEVSPFGFQLKGTYGSQYQYNHKLRPTEKKHLNYGITGQLNFLTKKFALADTTNGLSNNFTNFFIHAKGGAEVVIVDRTLGIYANTNWITAIDNISAFEANFVGKEKSYWFWEVGLRGLFGSKQVRNGLSLSIDLSFIIPQQKGREFINTVDNIYPVFRFGVLKSLGSIYEQ
ncbi:hypothetical protein [Siphonobacter curvatus]|nr:hypothetical protein [Siphonobacter curvatus]